MSLTGRVRKLRNVVWRAVGVSVAILLTVLGIISMVAFVDDAASDHRAEWGNLVLGVLLLIPAAGAVWLARHPEVSDP